MTLDKIKDLVEKIIEYSRTWSISETEWYWSVDCVRKSDSIHEKHITWGEFETAIREEILYDLVYKNASCLHMQMENDLCSYDETDKLFHNASKTLEKEVQKIIKGFKLERE